jgi:thioredoxin 1
MSPILSRRALLGAVVALPIAARDARGATSAFYTNAAFDAAQKAGKPILVHFWAGWCPTCLSQESTINKLKTLPKYNNLVVLSVDIDAQTDVLRRFRVATRSVLIAFKGRTETGREAGIISTSSIETLMDKAV